MASSREREAAASAPTGKVRHRGQRLVIGAILFLGALLMTLGNTLASDGVQAQVLAEAPF